MSEAAWVSFCISTYKRPELLRKQLLLLSQQTFKDFQVVVSDNDPLLSAKEVVEGMGDARFRYFANEENLGIIRSFNKSMERATTEFIVTVTDDDPVDITFLQVFHSLCVLHPNFSIYCGFKRPGKADSAVEIISKDEFLPVVLDPQRTANLLWSSAVIRRDHAIDAGLIPDYGSPHLADHAFLAAVGSIRGGVIINKMFSTLTSHESNFSKFNFDNYVNGCGGFYESLRQRFEKHPQFRRYHSVILRHLGTWFIANMFTLRKYYTIRKPDVIMVASLDQCASKILAYPFMRRFAPRYRLKKFIFKIKKSLNLLA